MAVLVSTCVWRTTPHLIVALDERFGEPVDAYVNGSQVWFRDDGPEGITLDDHEPGRIVRVKEHPATPMTVDDALSQMELVGHDFFLFHDKETDKATVVYRRHAYDYGLIRLA